MSTTYDIIAAQGTDLDLRFQAKDVDGNLIDLTQYAASGVVRVKYSNTGTLLNLQPSVHTSYTSGLIDVHIPANSLTGLPITQAVYDIKIYHVTGSVLEVVHGLFNINPAVTY